MVMKADVLGRAIDATATDHAAAPSDVAARRAADPGAVERSPAEPAQS
jgi:hypothetical protein